MTRFKGMFSTIPRVRAAWISALRRTIRTETSRPTLRSASIRSWDRSSVSVAKKSIVPITFPSTMIGRQIPDFTPARCATGARQQSRTWPRSATKTRSRAFQARPERPSPSRNRASAVTLRNSSLTVPLSSVNLSTFSLGSSLQNDP